MLVVILFKCLSQTLLCSASRNGDTLNSISHASTPIYPRSFAATLVPSLFVLLKILVSTMRWHSRIVYLYSFRNLFEFLTLLVLGGAGFWLVMSQITLQGSACCC